MNSRIEWTDATWNPTTGCTRVSAGCDHCYAAVMTNRLGAMAEADRAKGRDPGRKAQYEGLTVLNPRGDRHFNGVVRCNEDALTIPMGWRKPRRVFVDSMSDLFHPEVPFEFIDRVFDVMWNTPQHTYQILTKRPDVLVRYIHERAWRRAHGWVDQDRHPIMCGDFMHFDDIVMRDQCGYVGDGPFQCDHPDNDECGLEDSCDPRTCPLASPASSRDQLTAIGVADEYKFDADGRTDDCDWMCWDGRPRKAALGNLWLGFSAENQDAYNERMPYFAELRTLLGPHFRLFISAEPLLGPIDFAAIPEGATSRHTWSGACEPRSSTMIDWVIVGGESGAKARPMHPQWARDLRDQCQAAGVAFFFKQWGEWAPAGWATTRKGRDSTFINIAGERAPETNDGTLTAFDRVGKKAAGRLLDGREWNDMPTPAETKNH